MTAAKHPVLTAVRERRSASRVTDDAPSHDELAELVSALASIADHSHLRPWRLLELRGADRDRIGHGLADAAKANAREREKLMRKAHRSPLVLAIVVSPKPSKKVPVWEQEAVASGAAHVLSLLLDEAGWGVVWRTGTDVRDRAVRRAHGLKKPEYLLGWLYIGGKPEPHRPAKPRRPLPLDRMLTTPEADADAAPQR